MMASRRSDSDLRLAEALLFASPKPVTLAELSARLPAGVDAGEVIARLTKAYAGRGVVVAEVAGGWTFRTAPDLAPRLRLTVDTPRKPTRAAMEAMAIIAYHQPVTRGEIETIRGVALSKGAMDTLLEAGWIKPGKRRQTPGRPLTWITTPYFLEHFGLSALDDLPGVEELRAAGLLDRRAGAAIAMRGEEADDALAGRDGLFPAAEAAEEAFADSENSDEDDGQAI